MSGLEASIAPLKRSTQPPLSQHYAPSVFEKYTASVTVGNKEVTLNLYDTAGECTRAQKVLVVIPGGFLCLVGAFPSRHSNMPGPRKALAGWEALEAKGTSATSALGGNRVEVNSEAPPVPMRPAQQRYVLFRSLVPLLWF